MLDSAVVSTGGTLRFRRAQAVNTSATRSRAQSKDFLPRTKVRAIRPVNPRFEAGNPNTRDSFVRLQARGPGPTLAAHVRHDYSGNIHSGRQTRTPAEVSLTCRARKNAWARSTP